MKLQPEYRNKRLDIMLTMHEDHLLTKSCEVRKAGIMRDLRLGRVSNHRLHQTGLTMQKLMMTRMAIYLELATTA